MVAVEWQNYADTGEEQIIFIHHQNGQKCDLCDFKVITLILIIFKACFSKNNPFSLQTFLQLYMVRHFSRSLS